MNIKRLEIKGFKSFPDKTTLEFKPGICAIVGPNGCGKSNIFEAIRWVMGEQKLRNLRSKKMEEVIFNGSDTRKPVGMAEVRLILSNTGSMVPPSMADYDEIMITRRLLRDGEGQYEINNIPCRLSDVTDFFLDTGVGKNSYAIIEQGRVDMVVNSRPEDRRVLIEEAAGINRYKVRREAAIKKLERTRQNLLRISDVIGEVRRQNASLKKQAQRAERYRKLNDRVRELDIGLHAYRCSHLREQHERLNADLQKNRSELLEKEAHCSSLQAELEKERLRALQTEKALKDILEVRHQVDLDLASVRNRIERHKAAIAQGEEFHRRSGAERESLEQKRQQAVGLHQQLMENKSEIHTEMESARNELEGLLQGLRSAEQALTHEKETEDKLKEDIFRTLQEVAQERNRRENLKKRSAEILMELGRMEQETSQLELSLDNERTRRRGLVQQEDEIGRGRNEESQRRDALHKERVETRQTVGSLREELALKEKDLAATRARQESLEEMLSNYSTYDEGVRFLMQEGKLRHEAGLLGPVGELLEVPAEYQKALAAALGDRLGYLVVSSPRAGVEGARRLQEARAGRSTFIPLSPRSEDSADLSGVPEGLTRLKDLVTFSEGMEGLGEFLLGRCYVVEDLHRALDIWESNGINVDLVTAGGEVVNRHGEITGGSGENLGEEVFHKKSEIGHLKEAAEVLERRIRELHTSLEEHEGKLERIAAQIDQSETTLNEFTVRETALKKDLQALQAAMEAAERSRDVLGLEKERLDRERGTIGNQMQQSEQEIARLESVQQELEREREQAHDNSQRLSLSLQEKSEKTGELRVRLAQLEERDLSVGKECRSAETMLTDLERQLQALIDEHRRRTEEHDRNQHELIVAQALEKELMERHATQAAQIEALKSDSVAVSSALKALEEEAASEEKAHREVTQTVHGLEMEAVRVEQSIDALVEKIVERYQVDPRTVSPPDTSPEESEIGDLRHKLESLGEVNLAAIAESRYVEERLNFLLEQEADLNKAVESLYLTINKINKTTRERFREAFDSINAKFQEIFPTLFRGGEARLELTDEEDLLETGVDIMARPPGKRVRNMDLLSGGEKALTAVGLIFSIFLTRPSPFCLLDEVDAPLDDSNIARFNEMLSELSAQTQFLVITHNKRSMEAGDTLYGVTMEEAGCSAVVSVEFVR